MVKNSESIETAAPRNAIVTGSAGGLGRALSVRLARDGWRLALADVDDAQNRETLAAVEAAGGEGRCERLDVTSPDEWQGLRERLSADWPQLDLLVNNAGVCGAGEVGQMPLADWRWIVDVNLMSVIYGCHTLVDWLKRNPAGGHIVNVASIAAFHGLPTAGAYCLTKAAVLSFSETLAAELTAHNVAVTVVCPWYFQTGLVAASRMQTEAQRSFMQKSTDLSTLTAEEVAEATVAALASKQPYVVVPRKARNYWRVKRFLPAMFLKRVIRTFKNGVPESM